MTNGNNFRKQNPYIAGNPVFNRDGKQLFFGRQDIITQVERELHNEATNALVLFGQRRIGKTSLLRQLEYTLPGDVFFPVYFELQDQGREPLGDVLGKLADRMAHRLGIPFPEEPFDNEGRAFRQVFMPTIYEQLGNKQRLILLLDEFDVLDRTVEKELDEYAAARTLFPFLRSMMSEEMRVAFIFVLGRRIEELSASSEFQQTFKASLSQEIWLLNGKDTEALIRQAEAEHSLLFTPAATSRIYTLTAGHPYLTQMLCQRIWHRANADTATEPPLIDNEQVEAAIADTLTAADAGLGWLWDGLPPEAQVYAAALAQVEMQEGETISQEHVVQVLQDHAARLRTRQVEQSPRQLVEWRILDEKGQEKTGEPAYRYSVELMRRWVKERRPLRSVKEGLDTVVTIAEEYYQYGSKAALGQEWEKAIRFYQDALRENEKHFRARLALGEAFLEQGRPDEAIHELEKAYDQDRNEAQSALARALETQMNIRQQAGDEEGLLDTITHLLAIEPQHSRADSLRIDMWMRRGDEAKSADDLEAAVNAYERAGSPEAKQAAGEIRREQKILGRQQEARQAAAQKNWTEVRRLYTQLIEDYPDDERKREWEAGLEESQRQANVAEVLEADAFKMLESRDWENAINSYQTLLQRYPIHENRTIWENYLRQAEHGRNTARQFNQAQEALSQRELTKTQNLLQDLVADQPDWQQGEIRAANLLNIVKNQIQIRREYEEQALWAEAIKVYEQHLAGAAQAYEKTIWQRDIERCRHEETLFSRFLEGEGHLQKKNWGLAAQSFGAVSGERLDYTHNGKSAHQLRDLAVLSDLNRVDKLSTVLKHLPVLRLIIIVILILLFIALTAFMYLRAAGPEIITTVVQETVEVEVIVETTREVRIEETVVVKETVMVTVPPSPTPTPPVLAQPPTPVSPGPVSNLSFETIGQAKPFQLSGLGKLASVAYYPKDGNDQLMYHRLYAMAASTGVYIYDVDGNRVHVQQSNIPVADVAFFEDRLAAAYVDGTIHLWRIRQDGTFPLMPVAVARLNEHINRISFSPDGLLLAAASGEGNIQIWRVEDAQLALVSSLTSQGNAPINDVIFAATNDDSGDFWLAIAANAGTQLWRVNINNNSRLPVILNNSQANARSLAFSNDGRFLIAGTADRTGQIWEPGQNRGPNNFTIGGENAGAVNAVAYSPTADLLATASDDRSIYLWQLVNGQIRLDRILPGHQAPVQGMAFAPDGRTLVSVSPDDVALWPIQPSKLDLLRDDYGPNGAVTDLVFASDETFFASAAEDGTLMLWCARDGKPLLANPIPVGGSAITSLAIKFIGSTDVLAAGTNIPSVQLWRIVPGNANDPSSRCEPRRLESLINLPIVPRFSPLDNDAVNDLAFSPDGQILAAALANGWVKAWTVTIDQEMPVLTEREEFVVTTEGNGVGRITFWPTSSDLLLATGSGNGEITLYQSAANASPTGSKTPVVELEVFTQSPVLFDNLFLAPGNNTLFASARGLPVQSFSITEGENGGEIRLVPTNSNPIDAENVVSMALMPNPDLLASISDDGEARVWQLTDGRFISIAEFNKGITSLAVSGFVESAPLIIALGFADGTIALYGVTEQPVP